jgi:hypothetical protein
MRVFRLSEETPLSLSMHAASVPVLVRMLGNLLAWIDKAEAHAQARKFDPNNYAGLRLAPDMLPFARQIQIATDTAKGCVARLAGREVPRWADDEATLEELRARVRKALEYVQSVSAAEVDEGAQREIVLPMRSGDPLRMQGEDYLRFWVLPNFFFHVTTAYALLRHAGVEIGKADYLGR